MINNKYNKYYKYLIKIVLNSNINNYLKNNDIIKISKTIFYRKLYNIIDLNNYYFYIEEIFMENE